MPDKTYVMTDIHGRLAPLKALLAQIPDGAKIVFLGDYIDRGSESREVVELVRSLQANGAVCLRGNHEDMICMPDPHPWLANGGASSATGRGVRPGSPAPMLGQGKRRPLPPGAVPRALPPSDAGRRAFARTPSRS